MFHNYGHLTIYQVFENWYCAATALALFAVSLSILAFKRDNAIAPAKIAFAAGLGPFGFGMMRMILGATYDQNRVWYEWHCRSLRGHLSRWGGGG